MTSAPANSPRLSPEDVSRSAQDFGMRLLLEASHGGIHLHQYDCVPGGWRHEALTSWRIACQQSGAPRPRRPAVGRVDRPLRSCCSRKQLSTLSLRSPQSLLAQVAIGGSVRPRYICDVEQFAGFSEVSAMKPFILSFIVGGAVGALYALLHVRSPAPPLVALAGLLGMVLVEGACPQVFALITSLLKK
jgi:XapX domain-containing protein